MRESRYYSILDNIGIDSACIDINLNSVCGGVIATILTLVFAINHITFNQLKNTELYFLYLKFTEKSLKQNKDLIC